jgi:hypothetical protein
MWPLLCENLKNMKSILIQTDQAECYDEFGKFIACADAGQDASYRSAKPWPQPRFKQNNDNTVTDFLTDLMWTQNANLLEFPLSFKEALEAINEMNASRMFGFSDWRLPKRHELFSLISHANINPALPKGNLFYNVFSSYYWTATLIAQFVKQAWYIHLGGGRVFKGMKTGSYMVWPVRDNTVKGSERIIDPKNRFIVTPHAVTDQKTGLSWSINANIGSHPVKWFEALQIVSDMNRNQEYKYQDWRLPNIRELESIIDMEKHSPAIASSDLFTNIQSFYWSSTTSVYDPRYAWTLYTEDGNLGVGYKSNPEFYVWCVRDSKSCI